MSFEKSNISFRLFYIGDSLSESAIEKFAANAAPPISTLSTSPIEGWVTWRHLFDREITEEGCFFQPWLHLNHLLAEKKVPPALLRAYCTMEEDIECRARGIRFLPRKVKSEIKARVFEQLQPEMPPTLSGLPVVVNFQEHLAFAEALSDGNIDRFSRFFKITTDVQPIMMTPDAFALQRKQVNQNDLLPASFTDDPNVADDVGCNLGLEFLTWLWYHWEVNGSTFTSRIGEQCGYMLEGPVTFYQDGKGAHEALFRKGEPLSGREPFIALLCGKKLKRVKLTLAAGENVWAVTVDSDFCFRGLKLPKDPENPDPTFNDRMHSVQLFLDNFLDLYDTFLMLRKDAAAWDKCQDEVCKWAHRKADEANDGTSTETSLIG